MTEDFFSRLPVLLIESEEDKREHDDHHQHCRSGDAEAGLSQEEALYMKMEKTLS